MTTPKTALRRWMLEKGWSYKDLAEALGIGENYARKIGGGSRSTVSPKLAKRIEKLTKGTITAAEMVFGANRRRRAA